MLRVEDESGEVLLEVGSLEEPKAPESGDVATLDRATHPFWRAQVPGRGVGEPLRWEHIQRGMERTEQQLYHLDWTEVDARHAERQRELNRLQMERMNALAAELRRMLNEPNPLVRWLERERTDGPGDYFMRYRTGTNDDPGEAA